MFTHSHNHTPQNIPSTLMALNMNYNPKRVTTENEGNCLKIKHSLCLCHFSKVLREIRNMTFCDFLRLICRYQKPNVYPWVKMWVNKLQKH